MSYLYSYDKAGNLVYMAGKSADPPTAPQIVGISGQRIVPAGSTVTVSVVVADTQAVGVAADDEGVGFQCTARRNRRFPCAGECHRGDGEQNLMKIALPRLRDEHFVDQNR
jgi:hypothetical protein